MRSVVEGARRDEDAALPALARRPRHAPATKRGGAAMSEGVMKKVRLGRTDLMVTPICWGTSGIGDMPDTYGYGVDEERASADALAFPLIDPSNQTSVPSGTELSTPDVQDLQHQLQLVNGPIVAPPGGWAFQPRIDAQELLTDNVYQAHSPRGRYFLGL